MSIVLSIVTVILLIAVGTTDITHPNLSKTHHTSEVLSSTSTPESSEVICTSAIGVTRSDTLRSSESLPLTLLGGDDSLSGEMLSLFILFGSSASGNLVHFKGCDQG